MAPSRRGRHWREYQPAIVAALLIVAFVVFRRVASTSQAEWLDSLAWTLFSVAAAIRAWLAARHQPAGRERTAWNLLAAAALSWFVGMLYLLAGEFFEPDYFDSFPTPANWLFLGFAPLFTAGVLHLRGGHRVAGWTIKRLANLGMISSGVLLVALLILLEPILRSGASGDVLIFSILDPAAFVIAFIFTSTFLWSDDLRGHRAVLVLLLAAIAMHVVGDLSYFHGVVVGKAGLPGIEVTWLVAFAFQYLAAAEQDRILWNRSPREGSEVRDQEMGRFEHQSTPEALLPAALVVVVLAATLWRQENLSTRVLWAAAPLAIGFAASLGLREWWSHQVASILYRRLQESSARAARLLSASPAVVFQCPPRPNAEPSFLSANVTRELDLDPSESKLWTTHVHPEDRELVRDAFHRVLRGKPVTLEYRLSRKDGSYRWVDQKMTLLQDEHGEPVEIVGSIVDVSEAKELQAQVLSGQRLDALGRLSGGIAHDFNNILTAILGYAELLRREQVSPLDRDGMLETIQTSAERAADLTRQLLAFSRKQKVKLEAVEVGAIVSGMTEMLQRLIGDKIAIALTIGKGPLTCRADSRLLEQVVMNLILNARDAMPEGGKLSISIDRVFLDDEQAHRIGASEAKRFVRIEVADNGIGMTEEVRHRIFEPFFTTKEVGKGTGLGLASLHGIVQQHKGYIQVESAPGRGSVFRVYLPATHETPSREPVSTEALVGGTETVLVVDDEEGIPPLLQAALERAGYRALVATNLEQAIEVAQRPDTQIDVLISDVVLPDSSGPDLARAVRRYHPEVRVIYMSGYAADPQMHVQVERGEAAFLSKPIALGRLTRTLREVLDRDRATGVS